jgi:c-di-GMP-binding flagellar brake protein YcgR
MVEVRLERRNFKRIEVAHAARAASGDGVGQIINVSLGGMAIVHHGPAPWPQDIEVIDLQVEQHRFTLPVTVIWDLPLSGERSGPMRRCGVQFKELNPPQLHKLQHFIWAQASGWPKMPFPGGELD